jgi:hypothetical protein
MESKGRRAPRLAAPAETSAPLAPPAPTDPVNTEWIEEDTAPPPESAVPPALPPQVVAPASAAAADTPSRAADGALDVFDLIAEARAALARGAESMNDELASFARHSIDATAHTAIRWLGVKTWAEAVAVNTGFARTSFDQWLDSTAKVSELGVKLTLESSKPFVSKLGGIWSGPQSR